MSHAIIRVVAGVVVLAIYTSTLRSDAPTQPAGELERAERLLESSRDAVGRKDFAAALEPARELLAAFPNQQVYAAQLAFILQQLNRPAAEAEAWERFVDVSPTPVEACPALPDAYVRAGMTDQAMDAFTRCVGFDPRNGDLRFYLARAQERAGELEKAADNYREAIRLEPNSTDSRLALARLAMRAGRLDDAGRVADEVLKSEPGQADALLLAGMVAQRQGRTRDARGYLTRGLGINERYVDLHISLGILEFGEGHTLEARRHFDRAVELDPSRTAELSPWLERTRKDS